MEVSYRRELSHNYMIIEAADAEEDSYEYRMMTDNHIEGLLRFRLRHHENRKEYYYEITSKQPLGRILEHQSLSGEEIKTLVLGIASALQKADEYLLREEQILLEPDYIYVTPDNFAVQLCLVPGYHCDFPACVTSFLAYLMGKVNHQDKDGVILAYNLYHESLKENYGIRNLLESLSSKTGTVFDREQEEYDKENACEAAYDTACEADREAVCEREYKNSNKANGNDKKVPEAVFMKRETGEPGLPLSFGQLEQRNKRRRKIEKCLKILLAGAALGAVLWFAEGMEGLYHYGIWLAGGVVLALVCVVLLGESSRACVISDKEPADQGEKTQSYVLKEKPFKDWTDREESDNMEEYSSSVKQKESDTVLLFDQAQGATSAILEALEREQESIRISYTPFIIGKHKEMADYCLQRATVSRLHLRVDQKEGVYIITDLNSTNGTTVEGYHLQANETVSIKDGDMIYLADLGYRFKETRSDKL